MLFLYIEPKSTNKSRAHYSSKSFCGVDMPSQTLTWSITPRHDVKKCHKPADNSRILLEKVITSQSLHGDPDQMTGTKIFEVGCHTWYQPECSLDIVLSSTAN